MSLEAEKAHANAAITAGERRRAALAEVDEAKFSWFHAKACIVAGEWRVLHPLGRSY
jgi:PHS family inorganic phosphate transporter-like MFS transporter